MIANQKNMEIKEIATQISI